MPGAARGSAFRTFRCPSTRRSRRDHRRESCTLLRLCVPQRTTLPGPPLQEALPTATRSLRPGLSLAGAPPAAPQVTLGSSGQEALPRALSSFTELGGQPRVPGRGAGRWRAAGAEGTAGWLHTVRRLGCEPEAEAPHSPASSAQSFLYLRGHTDTQLRLQDWPAAPHPNQATLLFVHPSPSPLPEMARGPGEQRTCRGPRLCLVTWLSQQYPSPSPSPSELLTARAVEQLHDPEAVVQQRFGPHQLQASRRTQEVQHCFHLRADLHALEERKPLEPQMPPSACAEIPGELAGVRVGWANSSRLERGDQNSRE